MLRELRGPLLNEANLTGADLTTRYAKRGPLWHRCIDRLSPPPFLATLSASRQPTLHAASVALRSNDPPTPTRRQEFVDGLKFSATLSPQMARQTLTERMTDPEGAAGIASSPITAAAPE